MTKPYYDPAVEYTYGQMLSLASEVTTPEEARDHVDAMIGYHTVRHNMTEEEARKLVLSNIGYWSGYFDPEAADRIRRLYDTNHPIFGPDRPSTEEALAAGMAMATSAN